MSIFFVAPPFAGNLDRPILPMLSAKRAGHPVRVPTAFPQAQGIAPRVSP